MVIFYNKTCPSNKATYNNTSKKAYKLKHTNVKFSSAANAKRLTSVNKKFLTSLGFKVLI